MGVERVVGVKGCMVLNSLFYPLSGLKVFWCKGRLVVLLLLVLVIVSKQSLKTVSMFFAVSRQVLMNLLES